MKSKVKTIITLIGVLLSLASIFMLFLPAATSKELTLKGWDIFYIQFITDNKVVIYGASAVAIILIFLLVLGTVLSIASVGQRFADNKSVVKILELISLICLVVAGVLFFLLKETCSLPDAMKSEFTLDVGPIIGGVAALLSAVCSAITLFVPEKK